MMWNESAPVQIPLEASDMSLVSERSRMYVGGTWVNAATGQMMRVTNPATVEALAELPDAGREVLHLPSH